MALEILIVSVIGFILSCYALSVEIKHYKIKNYKAACDIKENISCTKAFSSKYGRIGILPNSVYGILFYSIVFALAYFKYFNYLFYLSVISFIGSVYLAYASYFKLKNFCLICSSIYMVNLLLLIFSYLQV